MCVCVCVCKGQATDTRGSRERGANKQGLTPLIIANLKSTHLGAQGTYYVGFAFCYRCESSGGRIGQYPQMALIYYY